jgi:hypothetical protein
MSVSNYADYLSSLGVSSHGHHHHAICDADLSGFLILSASLSLIFFGGKAAGTIGALFCAIGSAVALTSLVFGTIQSIGHSMLATACALTLAFSLFTLFTKSRRLFAVISGGTSGVLLLSTWPHRLPLVMQVGALLLGAATNFIALPYNAIAIHLSAGVGGYFAFKCVNSLPYFLGSLIQLKSLVVAVLWVLGAGYQLSRKRSPSESSKN